MVSITFLRQRAAKVKVPRNNSPWFLDWHGFLSIPLLQAIATPIKLMTNAIMNNLMQSLVLPIIATSRQLKQNRSSFRPACRLISTNRSNNFHCLASICSAVSIPRVLLRRAHDDPPVQGPAKNNKSEGLVSTCLAILPPYSLSKSSTKVMVTTCGPLWQ